MSLQFLPVINNGNSYVFGGKVCVFLGKRRGGVEVWGDSGHQLKANRSGLKLTQTVYCFVGVSGRVDKHLSSALGRTL